MTVKTVPLKVDYEDELIVRGEVYISKEKFEIKTMKDRNLVVEVQGAVKPLLQALSAYDVTEIESVPTSLKETFQHIYGGRLHA